MDQLPSLWQMDPFARHCSVTTRVIWPYGRATKIFQSIWCIRTSNKQTMRKAKMRFTMDLEQDFLGGMGHLSYCCLQIRAKIAPFLWRLQWRRNLGWRHRRGWTRWIRRLLLSPGFRSKLPLPGYSAGAVPPRASIRRRIHSSVLEVRRARVGGRYIRRVPPSAGKRCGGVRRAREEQAASARMRPEAGMDSWGRGRGASDLMGSAEMKPKPLSAVSSGFHPVGNGANRVSWGWNDVLLSLLGILATSHFLLRWPSWNLHETGTETGLIWILTFLVNSLT